MPHPYRHLAIHIRYDLPEQIRHVMLFSVLRMALTLAVNVYAPLYIYELAGSLKPVFLYFMLQYGVMIPPSLLLVKFVVERYGLEVSQFISVVMSAILLFLFANFKMELLPLISVLGSLSLVFYWIPQHMAIGMYGRRKKLAEEYATVTVITTILSVVFPVAFALMIKSMGYRNFLLFMCTYVVFLSIISLKLLKRKWRCKDLRVRVSKTHTNLTPLFFVEGIVIAVIVSMPVIIYSTLQDVVSFGSLKSLATVASALILYVISRWVDAKHDYALGTIGFLLYANLLTFLALSLSVRSASIALIIAGFISPIIDAPFFGYFYNIVKGVGTEIIFLRAISLALGRSFAFFSFLFLSPHAILGIGVFACIIGGVLYYIYATSTHIPELIYVSEKGR